MPNVTKTQSLPREAFDYYRNLHRCPPNMRGGMQRYLESGIPGGDYMTAVLANDLMDAVGRADCESQRTMFEFCRYLYNDVPMSCRGSRQAVKDWVEAGGLVGKGLLRLPETTTEQED